MTGTDYFVNTNSGVTIRISTEGKFIENDSMKSLQACFYLCIYLFLKYFLLYVFLSLKAILLLFNNNSKSNINHNSSSSNNDITLQTP